MTGFAALLVLVSAAADAEPQSAAGVEIATAQVTVEILRPAIVRQGKGWQAAGPDVPQPEVSRRKGVIMVEYQ